MIILARIDDRLIHGQVVTYWVRSNDIETIIIVDDEIGQNQMLLDVLKLSKPASVSLYVMASQKFVEKYTSGVFDAFNAMLLFADIKMAHFCVMNGVKMPELNIAGVRYAPNRQQYAKALSFTPQEIILIEEMNTKVKCVHQMTTGDSKKNILDIISKGGK